MLHAHPPHATALSMLREDIPACHYMIAIFGGADIRCAPYALFGTEALSAHALAALEDRSACLLASHGAIACGATMAEALWRMTELETLCRQFILARSVGEPAILTNEEIAAVRAQMKSGYGQAGR